VWHGARHRQPQGRLWFARAAQTLPLRRHLDLPDIHGLFAAHGRPPLTAANRKALTGA
jgi:hypothetical protein